MSPFLYRRALRRPKRILLWCGLTMLLLLASTAAQAVPAYARQTGSACADCHASAYGPALTPYGMRFKLNGFTDTDGQGIKIPVSMQLTGTRTVPTQGQSTDQLSEADLYLAGRVNDSIGGFVKIAALNQGTDHFHTQLSNVDVRYVAKDLKLADKDLLMGVSVNNNPGFSDPIGDLPAPSGNGVPAPTGAGTLLGTFSLAGRVIGGSVYGLYDASWYGEVGTYRSFPTDVQDRLGYPNSDPGRLSDTGYFRFAYMKDLKRQFYSAGLVGLTTHRQQPRFGGPEEDITDLGYDLSYQYLGNRKNIVQVSYVNIAEWRKYGDTPFLSPTLVAKDRGVLHDQLLSFTYTFLQSYGISAVHYISTGTEDLVRFQPYGIPNTTSNQITLFWTPFGKDDSLTSLANLKLSATWFYFTRYNNRSKNVFGFNQPGDARDLDAFLLSASVAY